MKSINKIGGIAALLQATSYLTAMIFFLAVVDWSSVTDPLEKLALLKENRTAIFSITFVVYVLFGGFLVILTLSLYEKLKESGPVLIKLATIFGIIWATAVIAAGMVFNTGMETAINLYDKDPAQAKMVWLSINAVFEALGGGNEFLGGLWTLLISLAGLKAGAFSKTINYLGLIIAAAGIISIVPFIADEATSVFGLGQMVWFMGIGLSLLKSKK